MRDTLPQLSLKIYRVRLRQDFRFFCLQSELTSHYVIQLAWKDDKQYKCSFARNRAQKDELEDEATFQQPVYIGKAPMSLKI